MKILTVPFRILALLVLGLSGSYAGEKVLIDTDFSRSKGHVPQGEPVIEKKSGFPMKVPSSRGDVVDAEAPSTITVSKDALNDLQPPFAVVSIKKKAPADIKPNSGPFGGAALSWNFRKVPLGPGKYEATWTIMPITEVHSLIMSIGLSHQNDDKTLTEVESLVHPTQKPLTILIDKTLLLACDERLEIKEGKPHDFKVEFDLNKNTWGAEVDGKKFFRNKKFPDAYLNEFPTFVATNLSFQGGATPDVEGAEYAVARVKLVKLDDDGSE